MEISDWGQQIQIDNLKGKNQRFIIEEKINTVDLPQNLTSLFFTEREHQFKNPLQEKENYSFFKGITDYYLKGFLVSKNKNLQKGNTLETFLFF